MRDPITNISEFRNQHTQLDRMLKRYAMTKRGKAFSGDAINALKASSAMSLKATNALSRIDIAVTANWKLSEFLASKDGPKSLFWVTITPAELAKPPHSSKLIDLNRVRGEIARTFEGFDYFGMIDIAFYPRRLNGTVGSEKRRFHLPGPLISFHIHLLAWGRDESELIEIQDEFNDSCRSLFPNKLAFFFRKVTRRKALQKNWYQLKAPVSAYTAYTHLTDQVDRQTGEILLRPSEEWTTGKRAIRPGEAAIVHNAVSHLNIPDLMLGGGRGLLLKREIIARSSARLRFRHFGMAMIAKNKLQQLRLPSDGNLPGMRGGHLTN